MDDFSGTGDITIIIPAYNESEAIGEVLAQLQVSRPDGIQQIIVVDDGSTDQTAQIAENAGVRVICHTQNKGYGASLKTGIRSAETELVLIMDADGQHRVEDLPALLKLADISDMVVGQRISLIHSPLWRMPGKWILSAMANYITQQKIPDLNSGLRIVRREVALKYLHLCPAGYSFSTTLTVTLHSRGYDVFYVPIHVNKRVGKSVVSISTGLDTIVLILRMATLFQPLRIFIPLSLTIGAIGVFWGIPHALAGRGVSVGSMLAIVTGCLLFVLGLISDQISQMRLERFE